MNLVNTYVTIYVVCIILLLIFIYYSSSTEKDSLIDRIGNKLQVLSGFFIAGGLFITYFLFKINVEHIKRETSFKITDRSWININSEIVKYYNLCPELINSLFFDWQKDILGKKENNDGVANEHDFINRDKWYASNYISMLIFQSVDDYLIVNDIEEAGQEAWIGTFLQWFHSHKLKEIWNVTKFNYPELTIKLIDYMFNVCEKNVVRNNVDASLLVKYIKSSNEFNDMIKKRNRM
jgi:hypothetical protein